MRVLALDTTSDLAVLALVVDGVLRSEIVTRAQSQHGETILPHIASLLSMAGVGVGDLELIAVGLGPGSFTGVRIGVATAKGLHAARRTPLVGVSTSAALAHAAYGTDRAVVIDAKKDEVFLSLHRAHEGSVVPLRDDVNLAPEAAREVLAAWAEEHPDRSLTIVGSGVRAYGPRLAVAVDHPAHARLHFAPTSFESPRGLALATLATERWAARGPDDARALAPIYVRGADAVVTMPTTRT